MFYDRIPAFAKINLFLDVISKRSDGYHNVLTVFQEVGLNDTIFARPMSDGRLNIHSNAFISGNLLEKVLVLLHEECGFTMGLDVFLEKKIPIGAGLGGGSSDAARFLSYIIKKFGLAIEPARIKELCLKLGSDVPFFINGGCQTGEARGEVLNKISHAFELDCVIVYPGFPISTAEGYKNLDATRFGFGQKRFHSLIEGLKTGNIEKVCSNIYNIFEQGAGRNHLELGILRGRLIETGALGAMMSGSGSCVFGLYEDRKKALSSFKALNKEYQTIFITKFIL